MSKRKINDQPAKYSLIVSLFDDITRRRKIEINKFVIIY